MEINDEKITLEVEYEYEEFKRAYLDSLHRIPIFAGIVNYPSNIVFTVAISLIIVYLYGHFSISSLLIILLLTAIFLAFISRIAALIFRKWFEFLAEAHQNSKGKQINLHRKFVFENDGIEVTFGKTVKKTTWTKIVKATEDDAGIFIFYKNYLSEFIPKRAFDAYEESSRLKNFIKNKIGDKAEL